MAEPSLPVKNLERIKGLEVEVDEIHKDLQDVKDSQKETNKKLDELLELKNKGMGAFWLISILMGAAFTAIINFFSGWWNG